MYDLPSVLFGMALAFPIYLVVDRIVYPFVGWIAAWRRFGGG